MPRLYVGNLPYLVDETAIRTFFADFTISNIKLIIDRETQKPKGFGFVDLAGDAQEAIQALDGQQLGGRVIRVNVAIDKPSVKKAETETANVPAVDDYGWKQPTLNNARRS